MLLGWICWGASSDPLESSRVGRCARFYWLLVCVSGSSVCPPVKCVLCVCQVTLMLMDQGPLKKHLGDAFKPDPNSSSFRRPVVEMNIASGCPLFVSQSVLETGSYIKDDTIFIKVRLPAAEESRARLSSELLMLARVSRLP